MSLQKIVWSTAMRDLAILLRVSRHYFQGLNCRDTIAVSFQHCVWCEWIHWIHAYSFLFGMLYLRLIWLMPICRFSSLNREIPKLGGKGHEPSRAENSSARVLAWASSARAHHYYLGIMWKWRVIVGAKQMAQTTYPASVSTLGTQNGWDLWFTRYYVCTTYKNTIC